MSIQRKKYLNRYDNLKWDVGARYKVVSVFDTAEHKALLKDGLRCWIYSGIYKGLDIEVLQGYLKKEMIKLIDKFFDAITLEDCNE